QSRAVIGVRPRTGGNIGDDKGETVKLTPNGAYLSNPECPQRNDESSHPFRAVQGPTREKIIRRNIGRASADAKRLSSGFLAHFPNESVVIKMEQGRSGHHSGEHALDRFDAYTGLEITERAVGENQSDVKTNERATAPEEEAHKASDRTVFLDPAAIIDPNQRK